MALLSELGESFFSSVVDAAPDGVLIAGDRGEIVFANEQAAQLLGYGRDELVGHEVEDLLPEDVKIGHRAHRLRYQAEPRRRAMGEGQLLRARRRDGTEVPVEISLSPLAAGDDVLVVAVIRDVTARVQAEDHLRRVLHSLDATDEGVFIFDPSTLRFSYVNQGAVRQVGYSADELLAMTPLHINPDLRERELRAVLQRLLDGDQSATSLQTRHRRSDGADVPVELVLQCTPPTHDGHRWIVALARDITERLAAQQQLLDSQAALREAEQILAVADDRERIARDLHDTVIQRLFAAGLQLQALLSLVENPARTRLENVVADLDDTIRDVRTAIFALQSTPERVVGFRGQLLEVVTDAGDRLGFEPRLQFEGPIETTDERIREHVLPVLREALSNAGRHGCARRVRVTVRVADETSLVVEDDGTGVSGEVLGGNGLRNMRARAQQLGGSFVLTPRPEGGTRLCWTVPSRVAAGETAVGALPEPSEPSPDGAAHQDQATESGAR